uniref:J domain-containing protein n=1 Tax=Mucochytrium quahogii TaxID=96639 RepID=A0A7S2SES9_9STRA|mmetsp:Transcript_45211/g.72500  ORF Transcript_45211/g.72500 Transcript_45211/m.72500 type:complete len:656 (+) Transcript_45211:297-2264(+)|eukprot:CAMPEP_0203764392 /NCGR_PEP_ID=MMETSP0098-20131031/17653_1 /ASSEMBLY_ACC=CAM_ASM_000208 /TAXON_ID=96639 /ORGANISM=" , Strain NY0313808BC1" /LENGTH=655 /DNA_ID=CAMNT_0050660233 /DNA_START=216 /DNA_END=2183 /DNA_ORIENTATION=-
MGRLEYDDSAFIYFATGLLTVFLVPFSFGFLYNFYRAITRTEEDTSTAARTSVERLKINKIKSSGTKGIFTRAFYIKAGILAAGWLCVFYFYMQSGAHVQPLQFNAWQILELEEGSSEKKIKKQYRVMSLKYHPDRNIKASPDDRAYAANMFEKVQKAHEVLTDPDAASEFMKSGNMEMSIGLPSFLLQKENHNLVLVVYLLVLVVLTPICVAMWYSKSRLYGDKMILNDSYNVYTHFLSDANIFLKNLPEVFSLSAEFRRLPPRTKEDMESLQKVADHMKKKNMMATSHCKKAEEIQLFRRYPDCERANILIHVYLHRLTDELTPGLKEDLNFILMKSKVLIEAMIETVKYFRSVRAIQNVVLFEQYMTQALWGNAMSLEQLPHFGRVEVVHAMTGKGALKDIKQYINAPGMTKSEGKRKGMLNMTDQQCEDVFSVMKILPDVELKVKIGCVAEELPNGDLVFEEKACMGDIMTAWIQLERKQELGPVHAPQLPFMKHEEWYVLFCQKGGDKILAEVTLKGHNDRLMEKIQFPSKGFLDKLENSFDFYLLSNSYVGFDEKKSVSVKILGEEHLKIQPAHPEDEALDKDLTLFEEAFGKPEDSADSDFADSDDESTPGGNSAVRRRKKGKESDASSDDDLALDDDDEPSGNKKTK